MGYARAARSHNDRQHTLFPQPTDGQSARRRIRGLRQRPQQSVNTTRQTVGAVNLSDVAQWFRNLRGQHHAFKEERDHRLVGLLGQHQFVDDCRRFNSISTERQDKTSQFLSANTVAASRPPASTTLIIARPSLTVWPASFIALTI